jgi:hypothetical protein
MTLLMWMALQWPVLAEEFGRGIFQTPITEKEIDLDDYAEWVDGKEIRIEANGKTDDSAFPKWILWEQTGKIGHSGRVFGDNKTPGPRHLRIAFKSEIDIGTVIVVGSVKVSVLKPSASFPGDMGDDSQWISAARIQDGKVTSDEPETKTSACNLWSLPPNTRTQAIRFTHVAQPSDREYKGCVGGLYILADRYANPALQANIETRSNTDKAAKMVNMELDSWLAWENAHQDRSQSFEDDPEWIRISWPSKVNVQGVSLIWAGFGAAEIQSYIGSDKSHPSEATEKDWQTIKKLSDIHSLFPSQLAINWVDFGSVVSTRAIRIKISAPLDEAKESNPNMKGKTNNGKRVFLGEFMALQPLDDKDLSSTILNKSVGVEAQDFFIPVKFTIPEEGYVTLVIEDKNGKRVRNLVSEAHFQKGDNIAWWDGADDLGRDMQAANHGIYRIPAQFVEPGQYHVRGLWRKELHASYEFGVYNEGNPPWDTADHAGAWLSNHCPPMSAMFVPSEKSPTGQPAVYLGCWLTEGPDGLIWTNLEGKKMGGKVWIGGIWRSAPYLARDDGSLADKEVFVYTASVGQVDNKGDKTKKIVPELTLNALGQGPDKLIAKILLDERQEERPDLNQELGGLASYNGVLACSLTRSNKIIFVRALGTTNDETGKILHSIDVPSPQGLIYDTQGRLWVLSGKQLLRFENVEKQQTPQVVIDKGLEDPVGITLDKSGNIYISDRGNSHQVKVFTRDGTFVRAIGRPGEPKVGSYDPQHMNNPRGISIDSNQHLWVAEEDYLPKRVSLWTLDGKFIRGFYGPAKYGGGGVLDNEDKNKFYYADEDRGTMEFQLDWEKGKSQLTNILYRNNTDTLKFFRSASPETVIYKDVNGKKTRYFNNCYNSSPTHGTGTVIIYIDRNKILYPVAALGRLTDGKDVFDNAQLKSLIPEGMDWKDLRKGSYFFVWTDLNGDGKIQPEEVSVQKGVCGGVTVMPDLSFCVATLGAFDPKEPQKSMRYSPVGFTDKGAPKYDITKGQVITDGAHSNPSGGGNQLLVDDAGNFAVTVNVDPFGSGSLCGGKNGAATWSYPSLWPGLHASHYSAKPDRPGEIIGSTRLLGGLLTGVGPNKETLWIVNGNLGNMYLFTIDGLFVGTLFQDMRVSKLLDMPSATRGMDLKDKSLHDENFWPTATRTSDGKVYIASGASTCLVRLDGLDSIQRISDITLNVTAEDLKKSASYATQLETRRKNEQGSGVLKVDMLQKPPAMDGKLDSWPSNWVEIDKSGTSAYFGAYSKPYNIRGEVIIADGKLYAGWHTSEPRLLLNSGANPMAPFKTGGTLELMIGANSASDPKRAEPVAGDIRVLVTQIKGKTYALVYRPVDPKKTSSKVPFSSPWRTVTFDNVDDVSDKVQLVTDGKGDYAISIPLDVIGLTPTPGMRIQGDIGILRGDGSRTLARTYWSNKATGIVSDVPSEAALTPSLWGIWEFENKP